MRNLIGSSTSEYPALFTFKQNKMASSLVYVTEDKLLFNKRSRRARQYHKSEEIYQLSIRRYVFHFLFSDQCPQDELKMFYLRMTSGRQAN